MPSDSLIEKCCLIANPAAGNPSQYLIEQAFEQKGLDWRFMTFEVESARLGDAMKGVRALGFHGVKIGEPFQMAVVEHVDTLTDAARHSGSVNCITAGDKGLVGDNTECAALVALVKQQVDPVGKRAMVIGAGRMARAMAMALAGAGSTPITITSRNPTAGQQLVDTIQQHSTAQATFVPLIGNVRIEPETAVLVSATSLGSMKPEAKLPLDVDSLDPKLVVVDVAYSAARTWLTAQAAQRGCRVVDGLALYVEQTALALQAWTGIRPDTVAMREAAEEFLGI